MAGRVRSKKPSITHEVPDLVPIVRSVARKFAGSMPGWEAEDLAQEALLKIMVKIGAFRGDSSLKTWATSVARNHMVSLMRANRQAVSGDDVLSEVMVPVKAAEIEERSRELRDETKGLLAHLKGSDEVDHGWEVLNLMLWSHADYSYVALAMSVHTRSPWTVQGVRSVVKKIKRTPRGQEMCLALGINEE